MEIINSLKTILADSYALYLKTQNYHWNVEGPYFKSLHDLFEIQYKDLAEAIDEIAELIRSFATKAPATFSEYQSMTQIKPGDCHYSSEEMLKDLEKDQEILISSIKNAVSLTDNDIVIDLLTRRMSIHNKNHWMLKSSR